MRKYPFSVFIQGANIKESEVTFTRDVQLILKFSLNIFMICQLITFINRTIPYLSFNEVKNNGTNSTN